MPDLSGRRIILAASRKADEIDLIIRKQGGSSIRHPVQVTTLTVEESFDREVAWFLGRRFDWIVLSTGIGVSLLFDSAKRLNRIADLMEQFDVSRLVARGHKTISVLKSHNIIPDYTSDDGTTAGIQRILSGIDVSGTEIAVQLYGGPRPNLISWLQLREAQVFTLHPYDYQCADDSVMRQLLSDILGRRGDAVAFTSASQVHYLMSYASSHNRLDDLITAFSDVIPAAVGRVTAAALTDQGVENVIVPERERMGGMVVQMAKYFDTI